MLQKNGFQRRYAVQPNPQRTLQYVSGWAEPCALLEAIFLPELSDEGQEFNNPKDNWTLFLGFYCFETGL